MAFTKSSALLNELSAHLTSTASLVSGHLVCKFKPWSGGDQLWVLAGHASRNGGGSQRALQECRLWKWQAAPRCPGLALGGRGDLPPLTPFLTLSRALRAPAGCPGQAGDRQQHLRIPATAIRGSWLAVTLRKRRRVWENQTLSEGVS